MPNEDVLQMIEQLKARLTDLKEAVSQYGCPSSLANKIDRIDDRIYALETEVLRLADTGAATSEDAISALSSPIEDLVAFARFETTEIRMHGSSADKALKMIQQARYRLEDLKNAVTACDYELPGYAHELDQLDDIVYMLEVKLPKLPKETTPEPSDNSATSNDNPFLPKAFPAICHRRVSDL